MANLTENGKTLLNRLQEAEKSGEELTDSGRQTLARLREAQGALSNGDTQPLHPSIISKLATLINPETQSEGNVLQRFYQAVKEQYVPTMGGIKRFLNPQVGQFGLSRFAQQEGEKSHNIVHSISPKTADILPPLTPRFAAEQIGAGALTDIAAPAVINYAAKTIANPIQQLFTGIPSKEWAALSNKLSSLRPSFLGGSPSKQIAGKALKSAEESAGMFKSILPSGLNKEYAQKFIDGLKNFTAYGTERGLTEKELSNPKIIDDLVKELTPQEIFNLREAITNTLNEWTAGKRSTEYYQFSAFRNALNQQIENISPALRKAQSIYADAAQRSKFLSLFPRTKYGEPSLGRMGFTAASAGLAGASGYGDPVEMAKRIASVLLITSPISHTIARIAGTTAARSIPTTGRLGLQAILAKARQSRNK